MRRPTRRGRCRSPCPAWADPTQIEERDIPTPTDTPVDEADPTASSTPATHARRRRLPSVPRVRVLPLLSVLAVLALAAAVAGGIYLWSGRYSATADAAAGRDQAVDAAEQIVVNINTVRPETLDQDLQKAQDSLADPMLSEYGKIRAKFADSLRQAKANIQVTPAGAALTTFDADKGTASAIVAINVTASSATTQPTQKQQLFQVEMLRTPTGWKATKAAPSTGQS